MGPSGLQVTQRLRAWSEGQATAVEKIMRSVYRELHAIARSYMAHERRGHTLQATALVNEAYVRLADSAQASLENWDVEWGREEAPASSRYG